MCIRSCTSTGGIPWREKRERRCAKRAAKSKIESEAVRAGRAGKNRTELELHQQDDSEIDIDPFCPSPPGGNEKFERAGGAAGGGGGRA